MRTSRSPARVASSTTYWMAGLSTTGSISLGVALVAGRKRVPNPAAGITALVTVPRVGVDEAGCSIEVMAPTLVGEPTSKGRATLTDRGQPCGKPNQPSHTSGEQVVAWLGHQQCGGGLRLDHLRQSGPGQRLGYGLPGLAAVQREHCLLYTSPSPRDRT